MTINRANVRGALRSFDFEHLFIDELGWDHHHLQPILVSIDDFAYRVEAIAEKRGMVAFVCRPNDDGGAAPSYAVRRKIEVQIRRVAHEHLIIYLDLDDAAQIWQWVRREPGRPAACREHFYWPQQPGDALLQKLESIAFSLEEEEALSVTVVAGHAQRAFDVEHVTKRFYEEFQAEHDLFLHFIKGIRQQGEREWYASLMLNRLMFTYFIQKKGFLDGDHDYLRHRLEKMQAERGRDRFHSFYRYFLLRLFHEGLGQIHHEPELDVLLGKVPYLNGGLFDVHELERTNPEIEIGDQAFERVFSFFDNYQWHLDERPRRNDNEINPDVLGYIFEQYINRKEMGAYYTREDITEYMSKSALIPYLLDSVREECAPAFEGPAGATLWDLLSSDPDRYIPPPLRQGAGLALPKGVSTASLDAAPPAFALPGESWREVHARRGRYAQVRKKLTSGAIRDVGSLVTLNLDLRQFAQDIIESSEGPDLLRSLWTAIVNVKILDPTCGSGAFLFAALNILEPLYEACLDRMKAFTSDRDDIERRPDTGEYRDFDATLARVAEHPNRRYFIHKSIILNNLFGVDIMPEAVEICKLRLFLKLAAQVDPELSLPNLGVEALPDVDFNIRVGNTLVGFARYEDVETSVGAKFDFANVMDRITESAASLQNAFDDFRSRQVAVGGSADNKSALRERLNGLRNELDQYLASEYGVDPAREGSYEKWQTSYLPFHWFVEFYGIMRAGGFDVIIGNPPYVQWSRVNGYRVIGYATAGCPDIFAACVERSLRLLGRNGAFAMILPISFQFSADYTVARSVCRKVLGDVWVSAYSRNPSALFSAGLGVRSTICVGRVGGGSTAHIRSSTLHRWVEEYRPVLFSCLHYEEMPRQLAVFGWPRLDSSRIADLFCGLVERGGRLDGGVRRGSYELRFKSIALYYISAFLKDPPSYDSRGRPIGQTGISSLRFRKKEERDLALIVALGKIALLWWAATGDDFHVTASGLGSTPVDVNALPVATRTQLGLLSRQVVDALDGNIIYTKYAGKWMGNYDVKYVRELTDRADRLLLEACGFEKYWDDVEVAYSRFMKATGERPGTVREVPDFGGIRRGRGSAVNRHVIP